LRHTCGSWLAACGVPLTTIKEIMRHGDLRVTSRYAHSLRGQEANAIESLPSSESQQMKATGTDGRAVEVAERTLAPLTPQLTPVLTPTAFSQGQGLSVKGNAQATGQTARMRGKTLPTSALGMERVSQSSDVINGAGGIRTPGAFRHNGFQDRRLKPLGHCSYVGNATLVLEEMRRR
jgi:hypothetical protein